MIKLIVATSKNGIIGDSNKLIWNLPADLKRFKDITTGHPIVMGRKTYESIGRPLPNRRNIIISRDEDYIVDGCEIYKQTINLSDQIYMTVVDEEFEGDTSFPTLESYWHKSKVEEFEPDEKNKHKYTFIFYERYNF